jgi:hypothetical protein
VPNLTLASGEVTRSHRLSVELIEASETPSVILVRWPAISSVTDPRSSTLWPTAIVSILAAAGGRLPGIRRRTVARHFFRTLHRGEAPDICPEPLGPAQSGDQRQ